MIIKSSAIIRNLSGFELVFMLYGCKKDDMMIFTKQLKIGIYSFVVNFHQVK